VGGQLSAVGAALGLETSTKEQTRQKEEIPTVLDGENELQEYWLWASGFFVRHSLATFAAQLSGSSLFFIPYVHCRKHFHCTLLLPFLSTLHIKDRSRLLQTTTKTMQETE
jgi:hypothetical protein